MNMIRSRAPRVAGAALVLVATGLLASGAAGSVSAGGKVTASSKAGGTLTIALAEDPDALDPTLARTFVGRMVFLHMCEKLYDLNAKLQIVPQLAAAMPSLSGKIASHRNPPIRAAITPTRIVIQMLMDCRPGTRALAMMPMTSPATM